MPLAKLNGININYEAEGHGEPLVMIMGFAANRNGWMPQIRSFKKYYRVITLDNRGVGKSDKPPGPYSTKMMADDTVKLMDFLGIEKAHILGLSMGGMIAQELAINYPQRVMKLILASTYASRDETSGDTAQLAKFRELTPEKKLRAIIGLAFNKPVYRFTFALLARIQTKFMRASDRVGIAGQSEACQQHNTLERLPLITRPTLVIVGTGDRVIKPVSSEIIAHRIPNAKLVRIQGGSHYLSLEMRKAFNREVLNFLKSDAPSIN
ncbi:MAG: alpha/beta hydrolase [Chloroflexi bacterium]|nr:alpha/beta hydrolase [Chloroflexota bacterium]